LDTPKDIVSATPTLSGRLLRALLYISVGSSLFLFGGVHEPVFHATSFLILLVCVLAIAMKPLPASALRPLLFALGIAFAVTLLGSFHALRALGELAGLPPGLPPFSPAFKAFVPPYAIFETVYRSLVPIAAFIASLILHSRMRATSLFLRYATLAGSAAILLTLLQFALLPQSLLFGEKLHYRESFTAFFVNRNTAATFCGMLLVSSLSLTAMHLEQGGRLKSWPDPRIMSRREGLLWASSLVALIGLALTQSRAGVLATAIGVLIVILAWVRAAGAASPAGRRGIGLWLPVSAAIILGLGMIFERVLVRFETSGLTSMRWCVYETMLDLALERPLLGFGLGSFETLASTYRRPECGIYGGWEFLHSFFLEAFLSGGLVLMLILVIAMAEGARMLWRDAGNPRPARFLTILVAASHAIVIVHSCLDFSIQIPGIANLLAIMLGAAWSMETKSAGASSPVAVPKSGNVIRT
jgi:hypothetical protein